MWIQPPSHIQMIQDILQQHPHGTGSCASWRPDVTTSPSLKKAGDSRKVRKRKSCYGKISWTCYNMLSNVTDIKTTSPHVLKCTDTNPVGLVGGKTSTSSVSTMYLTCLTLFMLFYALILGTVVLTPLPQLTPYSFICFFSDWSWLH